MNKLKFTPLEFEIQKKKSAYTPFDIRIYSVGVWNPPNMISDNCNHSFDSHFFGAVPYKFLVGKVRWQLFWHNLEKRLDQKIKTKQIIGSMKFEEGYKIFCQL